MAFFRRKKFSTVIRIMLVLVIFIGMASGFYYLYRTGINETAEMYEENLEKLKYDLYSLIRRVYVPKDDIPSGTILSADMFDIAEIIMDIPQINFLDENDMGKVNKVFLPAGIPVLKMSVAEEKLPDDLREHEFNMFHLKTNLKKGDFVDVRIFFPDGENFIVLSKKQIIDLIPEQNTIRLWLNESEIHCISSAIIDAYIHSGTKIYVTTYIMPELQKAAIPFYAANQAVLDLMQKDPNIVEKASDLLASEIRATTERNLNTVAEENLSRVTSGVNEEISKTKELIRRRENISEETGGENNNNPVSGSEGTGIFN